MEMIITKHRMMVDACHKQRGMTAIALTDSIGLLAIQVRYFGKWHFVLGLVLAVNSKQHADNLTNTTI